MDIKRIMLASLVGAAVAAGAVYAETNPIAYEETSVVQTVPGDDNGDGVIDEDESGWDCKTMGNHICGIGWDT
ncbi:hypothetical protein [Mycobacteroides salmoniphilum]|uniref:hypothetical protein n=1 Tax=Mycobacteroides salmoniphilum TaxID=404941 RepID=UPI0012FF946D|nr:hypothetical protein [Mycobacteroides salmoniphilum]